MTVNATGSGPKPIIATDALVVGAGFAGLCMTYRLKQQGISVQGVELGDDVGGTWYWNRYPGARTDSEGSIYRFTFSEELDRAWDYSEKFPSQPEVLSYLQQVADTFELRSHYAFGTRVLNATFDDQTSRWRIETDGDVDYDARFFISGSGLLSEPVSPDLPHLETFGGQIVHTSRWPHDGLDLAGKRVAVFGTGSTGIQLLPEVAKQAESVVVFQRTPNYVVPSSNRVLDEEERATIKRDLAQTRAQARASAMSMPYTPAGRSVADVSIDERQAIYDEGWAKGGFRFLIETFDDLLLSAESNETAAVYLREKIASIVDDPAVANTLTPTYPYGVKRPPVGTAFLSAFNEDHVHLVDLRSDPVVEVTESSIATTSSEHDVDVIIFATGFDVSSGPILRMNPVGKGGIALAERWAKGPRTYLSLAVSELPNFFMIMGPHSPSGNQPLVIEQTTQLIARAIDHVLRHGHREIEADASYEATWTEEVAELGDLTLINRGREVNSWVTGSNIEGKPESVLIYLGASNDFYDRCHNVAEDGFVGFTIR